MKMVMLIMMMMALIVMMMMWRRWMVMTERTQAKDISHSTQQEKEAHCLMDG